MPVNYIGEQLFWGELGNSFIILAFVTALLSAIGYFFHVRSGEKSWRKFGRINYALHSISVFGVFALLLFLIANHRFEYLYVWEHSSTTLPMHFIFSCIWEGQEGSFLIWMVMHIILSWVIIFRSGEWESGVMTTIALIQFFLASMLLGIVLFSQKIGSNPFVLLRDHPDFANLPFIRYPDYLSRINDGRGLNPLLQNYWMTIHPPTLFLGFAATAIPFAFAIAGILKKQFKEWVKPAIPWTFFAVMILGAGILMGAAWAYEALSFGGFWAWDPVENASLVPWLTMVGCAHVMLVYKNRQHSLMSVYLLSIFSFGLVLYSTFLTRSGILGDASVHAFTDLGMTGQLLVYLIFFLVFPVILLIKHRNNISLPHEDEKLFSREFWMYIGVMVLVISSIQITISTSLPVINKITGSNWAPPADAIDHYNRWQVPVAIILCLLIGFAQLLKYKDTNRKSILKNITFAFIASLIITGISAFYLKSYSPLYYALLFASSFAVFGNLFYLWKVLRGKLSRSGGSIAHIGMGLLLAGALISNSKKTIISQNHKFIDLGMDFPSKENILIEQLKDTLPMGSYQVVYRSMEKDGNRLNYYIDYLKENNQTGEKTLQFTLTPFIQLNDRMGNVAEPSTKHFLTHDLYTHITYAEIPDSKAASSDEWKEAVVHTISIGESFMTSNSMVTLEGLNKEHDKKKLHLDEEDLVVSAKLKIEDANKRTFSAEPLFIIRNFEIYFSESTVDSLGLKFIFKKINPESGKIDIAISEKKSNKKDFIIMKAIVFPGINILWIGCILMITGTLLAIVQRIKRSNGS